jgi:hypothetical protein
MLRARFAVACAAALLLVTTGAASSRPSPKPPVVIRQVIAVYLGTEGTDARSGMVEAVRDMRVALQQQAASGGWSFVSRGVSLEPSVEGGLRHLALLGPFDEVSLGGNWTNSAVVRYIGGDMSDHRRAVIPQVVLLEREVREDGKEALVVGPERELGRYLGADQISSWVRSGAPLPSR